MTIVSNNYEKGQMEDEGQSCFPKSVIRKFFNFWPVEYEKSSGGNGYGELHG